MFLDSASVNSESEEDELDSSPSPARRSGPSLKKPIISVESSVSAKQVGKRNIKRLSRSQ